MDSVWYGKFIWVFFIQVGCQGWGGGGHFYVFSFFQVSEHSEHICFCQNSGLVWSLRVDFVYHCNKKKNNNKNNKKKNKNPNKNISFCSPIPNFWNVSRPNRTQPLMEDYLRWKKTVDGRRTLTEVNLWWKTTFDGRQPLAEVDLWWKTIFDGRQPLMEDEGNSRDLHLYGDSKFCWRGLKLFTGWYAVYKPLTNVIEYLLK